MTLYVHIPHAPVYNHVDFFGTSSRIGVAIVNGRLPVSSPTPLYSQVAVPALSKYIFGRSRRCSVITPFGTGPGPGLPEVGPQCPL